MKALIKKLDKSYTKYVCDRNALESKAREVCDFNARVVWCAGDGHLILNEDSTSVAVLSCLEGRTIDNKLTEEEHLSFCI